MIKNRKDIVEKIIEDIKTNPDKHRHSYEELISCCMIDGAIDTSIMDAHSKYVNLGTNGGVRCDTIKGPCACGAWH